MDNNLNNFSIQDVMRFAKTPAGQQLIAILQQADASSLKSAKLAKPQSRSDEAALFLSSPLSAPIITQIRERPSRSAVAETQKPALLVEPVLSPMQPL